MQKELTDLKKKCFKYKHDMPFVRKPLIIESGDLSEQGAAGLYKRINGKHEYDFSHKIIIDNCVIDEYLNYKPSYYGWGKTHYKNKLKTVILHEIIHAFTEEYYGGWIDISGVANDASPVFLSVLYYLKGYSSHECVTAFKKSDLFKKLGDFKSFNELDSYLTKMLLNYEKVAQKHKDGFMIGNDLVVSSFVFGAYNASFDKYLQTRQEFINKTKSNIRNIEVNLFQLGCCTMPEQIDEFVNKKRYGKFTKRELTRVGVIDTGDKQEVKTIYKEVVGM